MSPDPATGLRPPLTHEERCELLRVARNSIRTGLRGGEVPPLVAPSQALAQPGGAFVSLHRNGQLRGCVGSLGSARPLWITVAEMARAAAMDDPRFLPLREDELADLDIEISRLGPLIPVRAEAVVPGRHGVVVRRGSRRGVLLPQVPQRHGWDRETFLGEVCQKALLPAHAWRASDTTIEVFEAEVFGEEAPPPAACG
jgi:AmmeMemoRadiSam system protein A